MTDNQLVTILPPAPEWADAWAHPEYYRGVTLRRMLAYLVDVVIVATLAVVVWIAAGMLTVLSFGLLLPLQALAVALVPLGYHALMVAGPGSATLGMRLFDLRVLSIAADFDAGGGRPSLFQAIIQVVAFYGSVAVTGSLILVVALFNARRRTLHDWLAGVVVVNAPVRIRMAA